MENWSASSRFGVNGWWGRQKLPRRPARFGLLRSTERHRERSRSQRWAPGWEPWRGACLVWLQRELSLPRHTAI